MNLVRRSTAYPWRPARDLAWFGRDLDGWFDRAFAGSDRGFAPALNVVENENDYLVTVELPGVDQSDIDITVNDNLLTIQGEKKSSHEYKEGSVYRRESREGSFRRSLSLPASVDAEGIKASIKNGVLELVVPKPEEKKARKVQIEAK